jgi:hypothetical protein
VKQISADLLEALQDKIDELSIKMEKMKLAEYVELLNQPWRLLYINFISGLARGLGIAVGFAVLGAIMLTILQRLVLLHLPGVSNLIVQIIRLVQLQLHGGI